MKRILNGLQVAWGVVWVLGTVLAGAALLMIIGYTLGRMFG